MQGNHKYQRGNQLKRVKNDRKKSVKPDLVL